MTALTVHTKRRLVTVDQAISKAIQITLKTRVVLWYKIFTPHFIIFGLRKNVKITKRKQFLNIQIIAISPRKNIT